MVQISPAAVILLSQLTVAATPPFMPDPATRPGASDPSASTEVVCTPGYAKARRHTSGNLKRRVYLAYGITEHRSGQYEIDHLVPLELGGADTFENLWPQSYGTQPWNARLKDRLENRLRQLVCDGQISLQTAQEAIRVDWIAAYLQFVGPLSP